MTPPFRPFRTRFTRLLACVLVTMALLVNGFAAAQASAGAMKKDCCAEMMGHKAHGDGSGNAGEPCPAPSSDCDDQCMMRCQASHAVLLAPFALTGVSLPPSTVPTLDASGRALADLGPGLRPPISA